MLAMFVSLISLFVLLLIIGSAALFLLMLLVAFTGRRRAGCSPSGCRSRGPRWWPVLLAMPLIFLLYFLSNIRIEKTVGPTDAQARHVASVHTHVKNGMRTSRIEADLQHRIARMDIHELMDKADAPRIALPPDPPAPPDAPNKDASNGESEVKEQTAAEPAQESAPDAEPVHSDHKAVNAASAENGESRAPKTDVKRTDRKKKAPRDEPQETRKQPVEPEAPSQPTLRPAWVNAPPKRVGEVWREVIETDEYATLDECYRASDIRLQLVTYNHLARLIGFPTHDDDDLRARLEGGVNDERLVWLARMGIGVDYIRREIAKDEFVETVERSFGPMKKVYTLIEFSPAVDRELRARWDAHRRQERFAVVGGGAASVLALLGLAWGLLQLDTLTKGYYTKRLFIGVPAAIMGVLLFLVLWSVV